MGFFVSQTTNENKIPEIERTVNIKMNLKNPQTDKNTYPNQSIKPFYMNPNLFYSLTKLFLRFISGLQI